MCPLVALMLYHYGDGMSKLPIENMDPLGFPWATQDPFLFCAFHKDQYPKGNSQLGPNASLIARQLGQDFDPSADWRMYHGETVPGFPAHPHRGFETVTVVNEGFVDHADSLGTAARYGQGDTQWLTAGRGIQHSEMFPLLNQEDSNPLELFQIWLNLPAASKMVEPHFQMFWNQQIPSLLFDEERVRLRIIAGTYIGVRGLAPPPDSWAANEHSDVAIWTIDLAPDATWELPQANTGSKRTLYYFEGNSLRVGETPIPSAHSVQLAADHSHKLHAGESGARLLLLQGKPIGEPVAKHGPFVMNTTSEL